MSAMTPEDWACFNARARTLSPEMVAVLKLEKSPWKKWRLLRVELDLEMPPNCTRVRQMKAARVRSMGVKMHATRPPLPMIAVVWVGWAMGVEATDSGGGVVLKASDRRKW
jgi:hypothetical protein